MWYISVLSSYFTTIGGFFGSMADSIGGIPLIGGPLATPFRWIRDYFNAVGSVIMYLGADIIWLYQRVDTILSWSQIWSWLTFYLPWITNIDGTIRSWASTFWPWLNDIWGAVRGISGATWPWLNDIWGTVRGISGATWPWLNDIWGAVRTIAVSNWAWLDSIDDRIWSTARTQWRWLDTIDDKIREVAYNHIIPQLGDWLISWVVLNVTIMARLGYKVLHAVWDMEWDDANKEPRG